MITLIQLISSFNYYTWAFWFYYIEDRKQQALSSMKYFYSFIGDVSRVSFIVGGVVDEVAAVSGGDDVQG